MSTGTLCVWSTLVREDTPGWTFLAALAPHTTGVLCLESGR